MKKIILLISILLSGIYLINFISAISLTKEAGDVLDNSTWGSLASIIDKIDVSGDDLKVNGTVYVSGKLCNNNGKCLGDKPKGTADNPGLSCLDVKNSGVNSDGLYYIDPNGGDISDKFQVYCDMTTDGGGWTLALNITQNILQPDLYNTEIGTPSLSSNYMIGINKLGLNSNTILKFTCQKTDSNWYSFYHKNISDFSSYLIISGSYSGTIECANDLNFTSNKGTTLTDCLYYNDGAHRYYTVPGWNLSGWANFNAGSPYLLRHCDGQMLSEGQDGRIWIK